MHICIYGKKKKKAMTHCCVTGKMHLLQTVLWWWKTRMQEWWISAWLHSENAPKPRLCPALNPVTVLLILHKDEIKTQSGPTCGAWADGSCTAGFWVFLLVCALSHIKKTTLWVFLIAFDYIKQNKQTAQPRTAWKLRNIICDLFCCRRHSAKLLEILLLTQS